MKISGTKLVLSFSMILLGSFLFSAKVLAATVYVSNSASNGYASGNDANTYAQAQSKATPLLTVTSALAKVSSGDTIVINDGTYTEAGQLVAADDNLTLTNDSVTGAANGVIIRAATGSRIFHSTYVSPGAGFTFGPIVLDANNTQANVVTVDGSNDINLLTFNGTRLLNPLNYWINSSHLRNLEMTDTWSASANVATAFIGFSINGGASSNGTYNMSGGTISKTATGATYGYILYSTPVASGLTVNFTNNVITMDGASASAVHKAVAFGAGAVAVTANVNNNDVTFSGSNTQNANFISMLDTTIALTAFSNDIVATGNHAILSGINVRGLTSANIYSNTFDYSGATISSSSAGIAVGNGAGTTSSCIVHDNSGNLNYNQGVAVTIGDDAEPGVNSNHITTAQVYNNNFSNINHGYLIANVTGAHVYKNVLDNAVIGLASKYSTNIQFDNNILKNITTGGALREKGGTGVKFYNNIATLASGGKGIYLSDNASGGVYKNNIIWTDQSSMQFVNILAGSSATIDNNLYYSTQSLPADAWVNGASNYNTLSAWQSGASQDASSLNTSPLQENIAGGNYILQPTSPAIDAGANLSLTSDYSGNSIYGLPDIGTHEYQPPYTFTAHDIPTTGSVRLYSNGQYRMLTATSTSATGNFSVAPVNNTYYSTTTRYMDITIDSWLTSGTKNKEWTATSATGDLLTLATSTVYTISDLVASKYYTFLVDGTASTTAATGYGSTTCTSGVCLADGSGQIQFTYTGGYSTKTLSLEQNADAPTNVGVSSITADSTSQLTAIAQTAVDADPGLHATPYYFNETSGNAGASASVDWQAGTTFVDSGLTENTQYSYQVKAKDANDNASSYSTASAKYTLAPTPTNLAATAGQTTITITVATLTNATAGSSGYYFSRSGANSGWVQTNSWSDSGLTCNTSYTYTVKYRNGDGTETSSISITTSTTACPGGGGVTPTRSRGGGLQNFTLAMGQTGFIGQTKKEGTNVLLYFNSIFNFEAQASKLADLQQHSIAITNLDMMTGKITLAISSMQKIIASLNIGDVKNFDLDADGINDISLTYNNLEVNRIDLTIKQLTSGSPPGSPPSLPEGSLVKVPGNPTVYLIMNNQKYPFFNELAFTSNNYKWSDIIEVTDLSKFLLGDFIKTNQSLLSLPEGSLVKVSGDSTVYLIQNNTKRPFLNEEAFLSRGYSWSAIIEVSNLSNIPIGESLTTNSFDYNFTVNLSPGDRSPEVKRLQQFLNQNGFILASNGAGSPGNETTYFGILTTRAVIKFQEKYAADILTPQGFKNGTGIVGESTRIKINQLLGL